MLFIQPAPSNKLSKPFYVEPYFKLVKDFNIPEIKSFIKYIDRGEYKNNHFFYDRFGVEQPLSHLSKGCKIGIVAYLFPDLIIDTTGCGRNAECIMIAILKHGHLIIRKYMEALFLPFKSVPIDVYLNGYRFYTFDILSEYFEYSYPEEPPEGSITELEKWPDEKFSKKDLDLLSRMRYLSKPLTKMQKDKIKFEKNAKHSMFNRKNDSLHLLSLNS